MFQKRQDHTGSYCQLLVKFSRRETLTDYWQGLSQKVAGAALKCIRKSGGIKIGLTQLLAESIELNQLLALSTQHPREPQKGLRRGHQPTQFNQLFKRQREAGKAEETQTASGGVRLQRDGSIIPTPP